MALVKTGMVASSAAGLAAAVIATVTPLVGPFEALAAVLGVAAAVLAAVGLLGTGAVTPTGLVTVVFSGVAFAGLEVAFLNLVTNSTAFWIALVAGFVAYLIGATAYGFAGQRQGVKVGGRIALLVLLLLAVIPIADVLGLLGILVTAIVRRGQPTAGSTSATPV
ncbi:MAG: hypothetical protein JWN80_3134 [Microbacteriaceae bacterium]|jgi:hypothetical protein|nr:hypothetical protein [Microbacteriaceae bacterium]